MLPWIRKLSKARDYHSIEIILVAAFNDLLQNNHTVTVRLNKSKSIKKQLATDLILDCIIAITPSNKKAYLHKLNLTEHLNYLLILPCNFTHKNNVVGFSFDKTNTLLNDVYSNEDIFNLLLVMVESANIAIGNIRIQRSLTQQCFEKTSALIKLQMKSEEASKAKSQYLATASHDLRQPLQQIANLNVILLKNLDDDPAKLHLLRTQHIVDNMKGLLDSILDLEKIENGYLQAKPVDIDLQTLLVELHKDYELQCERKGLELIIDSGQLWIHSDPVLLKQVLGNILSNAVKYTTSGKITIVGNTSKDSVRLTISDSGRGISPEEQHNIFKSFYQISDDRKQKNSYGLGLSVVKSLCDLLFISIKVESVNYSGTQFILYIPSSLQKHSEITKTKHLITTETKQSASVLYLEDDPDMVESVKTLLGMDGYQTYSAESKSQALQVINNMPNPPSVIVTDNFLMHGENGLDIVNAIREQFEQYIPAIMLTGYTDTSFKENALKTVESILFKPIDADELLNKIKALI